MDADALLILTDVPYVYRGYGTPTAEPVYRATPAELRREDFPAGSMGPKVEAACRFVELTGRLAAIGSLTDAEAMLRGEAGALITTTGSFGHQHLAGAVSAPGCRIPRILSHVRAADMGSDISTGRGLSH
ncbi:hypothetical protein GCM10009771_11130 [Nesterenkonia flava]